MRRAIYTPHPPGPIMTLLGFKPMPPMEVELIEFIERPGMARLAVIKHPTHPESLIAILSGRRGDTSLPSMIRHVDAQCVEEIQ